ncbi:MAG: hypothetical protein U0Y96_00980 [Candidatus Kapaibacterium sp.]
MRSLQDNLKLVIKSTKPGLQSDVLYNKLSTTINKILDIVADSVDVQLSASSVIDNTVRPIQVDIKFIEAELDPLTKSKKVKYLTSISIPAITATNTFLQVNKSLEQKLGDDIESWLQRRVPNTEYQYLLGALLSSISQQLENNSEVGHVSDSPGRLIASLLVTRMATWYNSYLEENLGFTMDEQINNRVPVDMLFAFISRTATNELKNNKKILADALHAAEQSVFEGIDAFSKILVSSNTGIGVSQGLGAFNGGLCLTFNNPIWQWGFYLNGEIPQQDSSIDYVRQPIKSLIAGNLRYTADASQFDFMGGLYFGDSRYKSATNIEVGLGYTYVYSNIITGLGLSYTYNRTESVYKSANIILNVKPKELRSPSIGIGFQYTENGTTISRTPVFYFSYPLVSKQ